LNHAEAVVLKERSPVGLTSIAGKVTGAADAIHNLRAKAAASWLVITLLRKFLS
jgi:hypothetical protein